LQAISNGLNLPQKGDVIVHNGEKNHFLWHLKVDYASEICILVIAGDLFLVAHI
jgi:hypothetical protein